MEKPSTPLFSTRFSQGKRTFFFDIRKSKSDKPFLKISSSALNGAERQRTTLTVFDNEVKEFSKAVAEAVGFIAKE